LGFPCFIRCSDGTTLTSIDLRRRTTPVAKSGVRQDREKQGASFHLARTRRTKLGFAKAPFHLAGTRVTL